MPSHGAFFSILLLKILLVKDDPSVSLFAPSIFLAAAARVVNGIIHHILYPGNGHGFFFRLVVSDLGLQGQNSEIVHLASVFGRIGAGKGHQLIICEDRDGNHLFEFCRKLRMLFQEGPHI